MSASPKTPQNDVRSTLVEVAAQLLRRQGSSAVTTRAVALAAGVQAPVIYRLFGDKDGLLEAVAEHVMATYVADKVATVRAAAIDDVDPLEDLHAGWRMQIDFALDNPALFSLLIDPERALRSPAAQAGLEVLRSRVRRVAAIGRLRVSEQRAVDLVGAAGMGAVVVLLATPPDARDAGLADTMFDAVLGQILTDPTDPPVNSVTAAAVAVRATLPDLPALSDAERHLMAEWLDRAIAGLQKN